MAVQVHGPVIVLVPLGIEQEILGVAKLLNLFGVELGTVGDGKCVVVGHFVSADPIGDFVVVVVLDVRTHGPKVLAHKSVKSRATSFLATLVDIVVSSLGSGQSFQHEKSCETQSSHKTPLEDGRVDARTVKLRPVDLKPSAAVLGKAVFVGRTAASEVDVVGLSHVGLQSARGAIDLLSIIGSAGAVDVETGKNFGHGLVDAKDDLDVSGGILAANSHSMLGPNRGSLAKQRIPDLALNLLYLLDRLLLRQAIQEQIDIGSRSKLFMVKLAHQPFGAAVLFGNRQDAVDNRGAGRNDVVPVQLDQRRLGKDVEVPLEVLVRLDNGGGLVWTAHVFGQGHDVACSLLLRLGLDVAGPDLDVGGVVCEERQDVDVGVLEQLRVRLLSVDLTKTGLIVTVGLEEVDHGGLWVVGDVLDQVAMRDGQLGEG